MSNKTITVVSGLPRSGTSLMMQMLMFGGMEIMTDNSRAADENNPKGFYELEKIKGLEKDSAWVREAKGKVIKVVSPLLFRLPRGYEYNIIFMRRKLEEMLESQKKMLVRCGESTGELEDGKMRSFFINHLYDTQAWLRKQPHMKVLFIHYNELLKDPAAHSDKIGVFLNGAIDTKAAASAVDMKLYRCRT